MSHTTFIRFAPLLTLERVNDPRWKEGRTMYYPGALTFLPGKDSAKLRGVVRLQARPDARGAFGCEISRRGLVTEVSLLSPQRDPAEPLARVLSLRPTETRRASSAAAASTSDCDGEVFYGDGTLIRRFYTNAVLAVGGKPLLRTSSGQAIRREGHDCVIDQPDGSQVIYSGAEGYREALRDGTLGVR